MADKDEARRESQRQRYIKNRDACLERSREWYRANKDAHRKRCQLRYLKKREEILARNRARYAECAEAKRERRRELYWGNRDEYLEYQFRWRQKQKKAALATKEQARIKNAEYQRRHRAQIGGK